MNSNIELRESILRIALQNAIRHSGKAEASPVIGKILSEKPELRTKVRELSPIVDDITSEINNLSLGEQKRIVEERWPETLLKDKVDKTKHLPPLPKLDRYVRVVTRFAPNPDCVLHLGSARAIVLCHEYARMYKGKFIIRFEDTDPKVKRPVLEFYDGIRNDLDWLGCKPNEEYIQSDRLSIYYEYAEAILQNGYAYICTCKPEQFREQVLVSKSCECRDSSSKRNVARWHSMIQGGYKEGEAVFRVKTDLEHPNPAVRDWPAFRVVDIDKYPHPRVGNKYRVWPLYNFASGIDDHIMGVTHIIRGKEHLTNMVRQEYLYKYLGWQYPETVHYGRLKIVGAYLSKSKILQGVRDGLFKGWDDPRLATFAALRRRGITPGAIEKLIMDIGPKTSDIVLSWENLYAYNRKILDPVAERYFFVQNPVKLIVKNTPKVFKVKLHLHPERPEGEYREYAIEPKGEDNSTAFWISKKDADAAKTGSFVRLMGLFNIEIGDVELNPIQASFVGESHKEAKIAKIPLIHWILVGAEMPCQVIMPNAASANGIAESACEKLMPNRIVQFERFGFVRIDENNVKLAAYYAHK